ncbi:MAG: aminotransferase class IV [Bacteroidales bacterium]|nr:aminotransferase class IV [Bacteroidales bacterium]
MKNDFPLFESIRVFNGSFQNLALHEKRMQLAQEQLFGKSVFFDLASFLNAFNPPQNGLYKCRLTYGEELSVPEFLPYHKKNILSLRLVESNNMEYSLKLTDRSSIQNLFEQRNDCDDVLIVRNGRITDTSYCNIVFENDMGLFSPQNPLLEGVQRALLLQQRKIETAIIGVDDIKKYSFFYLINAMIPLEEAEKTPIENIF